MINAAAVFPGGRPANEYVSDFLRQLEATEGPGRPMSRAEFEALVRRMDGTVYAGQLTRYATPISRDIQTKEHENYTRVFLTRARIARGVSFLHERRKILGAALRTYGVRPEDIVAILMWESGLGEFTGDYLLLNLYLGEILYLEDARNEAVRELNRAGEAYPMALSDSPDEGRRLARLRRRAVTNLAILLRSVRAEGVDPATVRGSWGGAIGYAQFLPQSLGFAVDGDGDGRADLTNWDDCIFSVANYLARHGYGPGTAARRRAFLAYNSTDAYANGVLLYARAIRERAGGHRAAGRRPAVR